MCELGGEPEYVHSPTRGWVCTLHTSQTKDAQNTDRSSNCIQWIIKLHELHHPCPVDGGRGGGMRPGQGLNARRVPMQFGLIKKPRGLHSNASPRRWPSPPSLPHEEFHGAIYFSGWYFHLQPMLRDPINCRLPHLCKHGGHTWMFAMQNYFVHRKCCFPGERERERERSQTLWVCVSVFRIQLFTLTQKPITITLKNNKRISVKTDHGECLLVQPSIIRWAH